MVGFISNVPPIKAWHLCCKYNAGNFQNSTQSKIEKTRNNLRQIIKGYPLGIQHCTLVHGESLEICSTIPLKKICVTFHTKLLLIK